MVGFGRYVVLLAVGLERSERFWRVLGRILGRGGRLGSLRSLASGRSGAFWTVLEGFGRHLCRSGLLGSLRSFASGRSGAVWTVLESFGLYFGSRRSVGIATESC